MDGREEEEGRGRFFNISFFPSLSPLVIDISITPCLIPWHERFLELTEAGEEPV